MTTSSTFALFIAQRLRAVLSFPNMLPLLELEMASFKDARDINNDVRFKL